MIVVVKVGTSSLTDKAGNLEVHQIQRLISQIAKLKEGGHQVVLVTSAAIAAGRPALNIKSQPTDYTSLQALATIGQSRLLFFYEKELNAFGLVGGQVLLTLGDFFIRKHYLRVRAVIEKLLELGVIPIVNENDAITDEEIRFGDNDRLAAMMAHLVKADLLVLLTDTKGIYTADPNLEADVSLIREIEEIDKELELAAGNTRSETARGGMSSKLAAARIAAWSGIECVIASAFEDDILSSVLAGEAVGTRFKPSKKQISARKLWIGFASQAKGFVQIDSGARDALVDKGKSLLLVGVTETEGNFESGDAIEVRDSKGELIAKGLASISQVECKNLVQQKETKSIELIHRDDLVVLSDFI